MKRTELVLLLAVSTFAATGVLASGGEPIEEPVPAPSPAAVAAGHYNEGLSLRDQAWALEKDASDPALAPDKRKKLESKIQRAYERAGASFERALEADPAMYQAWSMLGYSLRRTGDHTAALTAYDRALSLKPDYAEAIEYRGEAYLGLNRTDDARAAYERLSQVEPAQAAKLLEAMDGWITARRADPAGVAPAALDTFAAWVTEQRSGRPAQPALRRSGGW